MIYFIRNTRTGSYKIGYSETPKQRLVELQTGNEDELVIDLIIPGGPRIERFIHAACDKLRIRGEWFHASEELLASVETLRLGRLVLKEHGKPAYNTLRCFTKWNIGRRWIELWLRSLSNTDSSDTNSSEFC